VFDSDRATKKEILTQLEHKMKNLKQISEVYRHAQDKLKAAVDTKKKLLAEYKFDLAKLDQKIKLLEADFNKKEEQMKSDEKTLTQLEQKFKTELGILPLTRQSYESQESGQRPLRKDQERQGRNRNPRSESRGPGGKTLRR